MNETKRTLNWEGCHNVRDLGGLPAADGGFTASRHLIRADVLGRLTPEGKRQMLDYGVRTIIDLRKPEEIAKQPSAVFEENEDAPLYLNLPAMTENLRALSLFKKAETRAELYNIANDHFAENSVRILRAVANAAPGGLVFHCHSGKDRTAIIAALLLDMAGVPREQIAGDYAQSQTQLWPLYQKWVDETGGEALQSDPWSTPICEPQTMLDMLEHLDAEYGGTEAYLLQAGQTPQEIAQLKAILT